MNKLFSIWILLIIGLQVFGQKTTFTAKVDRNSVSTDDYVVLQITAQGGEIESYSQPALENFSVLQNYRNSGSNISIVNGKMTSSTTYTWVYYIQPTTTGEIKIEAATAKIDGKEYSTNEITVNAVKGSGSNSNPGLTQNNPNTGKQNNKQPQSGSNNAEIFINAYVDKTKVYVGQQINASYKLYTRVPIYEYGVSTDATFNGFLKNEINLGQPKAAKENLNGQQYNAAVIKQTQLFAQFSGTFESTPLEVDMVVEVRKPWGMFGYYSDYEQRTVKSNTVTLEVMPLPEAGKPLSFTGAVGEYEFEVELPEEGKLKTDEEFTLRTIVKGEGNIHMIDPPEIALPQDFEVYDPQVSENISRSNSGYSGEKVFEYLVVPRQPGSYDIESLEFSYFDPSAEEYISLSSPQYTLDVEGEATVSTGGAPSKGKASMEEIDSDIRFIKTDAKLQSERRGFYGKGLSIGLYASPILAFMLLLFVRRRQQSSVKDVVQSKRRRASRQARKRLATARKLMKQQDAKSFYDELSRAVQGYVSDKLNIPFSQLNRDSAAQAIAEKDLGGELSKRYTDLLDDCEMALFGASGNDGGLEKAYEEAAGLIDEFEKQIRS